MEAAPAAAVYDDYKFVTAEELGSLGLSSLVGTKALRPYMHGFFVDSRLHAKAVSLSQPFAYEQWRKQRVQERLGAKTAGRIAPVKKERPPKVNAALAEEIATRERQAVKEAARKARRSGTAAATAAAAAAEDDGARAAGGESLLDDGRFKALFSDKDFEIDVTSEEYLARRPHARGQLAPAPAPVGSDDDDDDDDEEEEDGEDSGEEEGEDGMGEEEEEEEEEEEARAWSSSRGGRAAALSAAPRAAQPRNREPRMVGVQSDVLAGGASSMAPVLPASATFGARLAALPRASAGAARGGAAGAHEMTFSATDMAEEPSDWLGEDDFAEDAGWGKGGKGKGGKGKGGGGKGGGGKGGGGGGAKGKGAKGGGAKGAAGAKGAGGGRGRGLPGAGGGERSERRGMLERHLTPQRGKGGKGGKGKGKGKGGISKRGGGRGGGRR